MFRAAPAPPLGMLIKVTDIPNPATTEAESSVDIVHNNDFLGRSGLREDRIERLGDKLRIVVHWDDDRDGVRGMEGSNSDELAADAIPVIAASESVKPAPWLTFKVAPRSSVSVRVDQSLLPKPGHSLWACSYFSSVPMSST